MRHSSCCAGTFGGIRSGPQTPWRRSTDPLRFRWRRLTASERAIAYEPRPRPSCYQVAGGPRPLFLNGALGSSAPGAGRAGLPGRQAKAVHFWGFITVYRGGDVQGRLLPRISLRTNRAGVVAELNLPVGASQPRHTALGFSLVIHTTSAGLSFLPFTRE